MALRWATAALLAVAPFLPLTTAAAQSQTNVFTSNSKSNSSGSSPTWQLGQEVTLTWDTDFFSVALGFMSASDEGTYISFYDGSDNSTTWTVDVNGTSWASNNVVYYMVIEGAGPAEWFYSQPVYIVAPGASANTLSTSVTQAPTASVSQITVVQTVTPTQATTTGSAGATTTGANANANAAAATNSQAAITAADSDRLGNGTIAGIAVGAVAGVAAAAAAIFFLLRNRRLKRELMNTQANTRSSYMPYDQLPPNSGMAGGAAGAFSPDLSKSPGFMSGAGLAPAAAAGGYYGQKGHSTVSQLSELPVARANSHRISELPGGPVEFADREEPVEIGGTELTRPMDEFTPQDARPLMGEHPRDTTD